MRNRFIDSLLDNWSNFDFKPKYNAYVAPIILPSWISDDETRRLRAYAMLDSYCKNKSRVWLSAGTPVDSAPDEDRREYGEAGLIVKTTLSSLTGDDWNLKVDGAIGKENADAVAQQELLESWMEKEQFALKMIESETQSIKFGDSIYVIGWDESKQRPRLHVYDPSFYFPQFKDRSLSVDNYARMPITGERPRTVVASPGNEEFPEEVYLAWEFEEETRPDHKESFVRKITWTLVPVDEYTTAYGTSDKNCLYSDEIFSLENAAKNFTGEPEEVVTEETFLNIDFIPVVHVPNTVSLQDHYGESVLADVLQVIDDIQSVDTDLQAAAATTGTPPIAISGFSGGEDQYSYGPGTVLKTGDGNATIIDTSKSLDALMKLKDALLERLAVNSRTPESLLGRVKPNEVPSGIALTLSFTPHAGMIKQMRLVRYHKYALLFKFIMRMYKANGLFDGEVQDAYLSFGSFLPADRQEAMNIVSRLLETKAISLETAIEILSEAGYPIEDWVQEIERIESRDYEGAQSIMTITGNPDIAAERLGISLEDAGTNLEDEMLL